MDGSTRPDLLARRGLPHLLGRPGFDLPEVGGYRLITGRDARVGPLAVSNPGSNMVLLDPDLVLSAPLGIAFAGTAQDNLVVLGRGADLFGQWKIGSQSSTFLCCGQTRFASSLSLVAAGRQSTFYLGPHASSNGLSVFLNGDGTSIVLGEDCMIAQRVTIMTSDVHAIVDKTSREWLNPPASVVVDPHVWLGWESMLMKGASVGFGSLIGARSMVRSAIPANCSAAGVPAKVRRRNIQWLRTELPLPQAIGDVEALERRCARSREDGGAADAARVKGSDGG